MERKTWYQEQEAAAHIVLRKVGGRRRREREGEREMHLLLSSVLIATYGERDLMTVTAEDSQQVGNEWTLLGSVQQEIPTPGWDCQGPM